jgi:hypothetical protein
MTHTDGIEWVWSMLKRGYQGTYHKMSAKRPALYINEFARRHNVRMADVLDRPEFTVQRVIGRRLRDQDLVKGNRWRSSARSISA